MDANDPHFGFNFAVTITPQSGQEIKGSFMEISGLGGEITYADYREGTDPENNVRKLPGLNTINEFTCKRGVVSARELTAWFDTARKGDPQAKAKVQIKLKSEDQQDVIATWEFEGARPSKWTGPTLNATSSDVAMEELTIVCNGMKYV